MRYTFIVILLLFCFSPKAHSQASSEKLIRKGVSLHDKGKYTEALGYFEQALKINPSSLSATYEMSLSYLHLKDYENALKYSTKVINANFQPLLVEAYCVKASALAELNKVNDAIKLLNDAISRYGDEYLLHYNLGLTYFNQKKNNEALLHLSKAIEIDPTHAGTFLLYSYALSDSGKWVQSFLSFHFFLLLEPNTARAKDAFGEMYDLLTQDINDPESPLLDFEDGIDRKKLYAYLQKTKPTTNDNDSQFKFFEQSSKTIFFTLGQIQSDTRSGLLWDFFVPIFAEILESGHFDAYCRYISSSYFPESLEWWNKNSKEVDDFISWFEDGQGSPDDEYNEYGDDDDDEADENDDEGSEEKNGDNLDAE
ncbi:tetratricopeptide (TPR) repeat protein [Dysgonomonas sp. PH5-45]|uniref:tetratricopeptide repeat protein n=1 Tax=unclassified Dysgonomonas TaxID=2630389 RepID=UPI00247694B6|nr:MULTISPECIES: tetratricopeptide repeat protein [unclassified Dysgonomonas]MDH6356095.1 tetratricopeptide (TPR) repeat protein [Dysgonomonas sp. PH5-45]MDH6388989.1 tetratricopeptide (TPR) repeat protein [Dysgonomonas sp. PH5-37]